MIFLVLTCFALNTFSIFWKLYRTLKYTPSFPEGKPLIAYEDKLLFGAHALTATLMLAISATAPLSTGDVTLTVGLGNLFLTLLLTTVAFERATESTQQYDQKSRDPDDFYIPFLLVLLPLLAHFGI